MWKTGTNRGAVEVTQKWISWSPKVSGMWQNVLWYKEFEVPQQDAAQLSEREKKNEIC